MDTNGITTTPDVKGTITPKSHAQSHHKGYFLSEKAKVNEIDGIRGLLQHEKPGVVSFLTQHNRAGKPNPETFPFESIILNLKPPLSILTDANGNGNGDIPKQITIEGNDLAEALQYGPTPGLSSIRGWLEDLQADVHGREKGEWSVSLGSGSQDLMSKGFSAVLNPGDPVLLETPLYAGVLPPLKNLNAEMIEVDVDHEGLSAVNLERILDNWPQGKTKPKVVYCCPVGCNPSGCSSSRQRKLDVLRVAKKHNLLIFEDDPYYYLTTTLIPSYFALELEVFPEGGHVIRFDSFSKLLAAGMRLGYATGPKEILHAIDVNTAGANLHTSSVSQAVAYGLLKTWGRDQFLAHAAAVARFYASRRERFEAIAHKHLDGLATWVSPVAGMFLWIDLSPAGITDSFELIRHEALAKGVLAVPGFSFYPNKRTSSHVRVSFSLVDLEVDAEKGFERLAEAIRDKQKQLGLV